MPQCPIELAQNGIISNITVNGIEAPKLLARAYSDDEIIGAAIKSMVFNSTLGAFVRSMMIKTIGLAGDMEDAVNVLLPLLDSAQAKNREKYTSQTDFGNGEIKYKPDKNARVREATLIAIEQIVNRQEGGIKKPVAGEFGKTIVSCALLDPSEPARITAARLIGTRGTRQVAGLLVGHTANANSAGDTLLYARGEAAVNIIVEVMKERRITGTFLSVLLGLATTGEEGNQVWALAEKSLLALYNAKPPKMQRRIHEHVLLEDAKLSGIADKDIFRKKKLVLGRYTKLLLQMNIDEEALGPIEKKKPIRPKRAPEKIKHKRQVNSDEKPYIERGPAVEAVRRLGRGIIGKFRGPGR